MIYIAAARLVILSQAKTGSVALENAVLHHTDWAIRRPGPLKHMTYGMFRERFAPLLEELGGLRRGDYEVVAVMRQPLDWFGSLYRFNTRETWGSEAERQTRYLGDLSFEDYIKEVCKPYRARTRQIDSGSPCRVALDTDRTIGVDRIFPYEDLSGLIGMIEKKIGETLTLKRANVSPTRDMGLSAETRARFETTYALETALHASLRPDGTVASQFRATPMQPNWV
jgi:hypothetical protein